MSNDPKRSSLAYDGVFLVLTVLCFVGLGYAWYIADMSIAFFVLGGFAFVMFIICLIDLIRKKHAKANYLLLIIPLVIAVIFIGLGLLIHLSNKFEPWLHWGGWLLLLGILLFIIGVILVIASLKKYLSRKKLCICTVEAECVEIRENYDHKMKDTFYTPVWEFELNGETKRAVRDYQTNRKTDIGTRKTLHVDPDDVNNFYQDKIFDGPCVLLLGFGGGFMLLGIVAGLIYAILTAVGVF